MSIIAYMGGFPYNIPENLDEAWGVPTTNYLVAISNHCLQDTTTSFPLATDINFGNAYGILLKYITSVSLNPATSGVIRLAHSDSIGWRNESNTGNYSLIPGTTGILSYNGKDLVDTTATQSIYNKTIIGGSFTGISGTFSTPVISGNTGLFVSLYSDKVKSIYTQTEAIGIEDNVNVASLYCKTQGFTGIALTASLIPNMTDNSVSTINIGSDDGTYGDYTRINKIWAKSADFSEGIDILGGYSNIWNLNVLGTFTSNGDISSRSIYPESTGYNLGFPGIYAYEFGYINNIYSKTINTDSIIGTTGLFNTLYSDTLNVSTSNTTVSNSATINATGLNVQTIIGNTGIISNLRSTSLSGVTGIFSGLYGSTVQGNTGYYTQLSSPNISTTGILQQTGNLKGIYWNSSGATGLKLWRIIPVSDGRLIFRSVDDADSLTYDPITMYKDPANGIGTPNVMGARYQTTKYITFGSSAVVSDLFINTATHNIGVGSTGPANRLTVAGDISGTTGILSAALFTGTASVRNVIPTTADTYDVGSTGLNFNNVYTKYLTTTEVKSDLTPITTNTRSLGSITKKWKDAFLAGSVTIDGNLTVLGTTTEVSQSSLAIQDNFIKLNVGGTAGTAEGGGIIMFHTGPSGATGLGYINFDSSLQSKWKAGPIADLSEIATVSHTQTLTNKQIIGTTGLFSGVYAPVIKGNTGLYSGLYADKVNGVTGLFTGVYSYTVIGYTGIATHFQSDNIKGNTGIFASLGATSIGGYSASFNDVTSSIINGTTGIFTGIQSTTLNSTSINTPTLNATGINVQTSNTLTSNSTTSNIATLNATGINARLVTGTTGIFTGIQSTTLNSTSINTPALNATGVNAQTVIGVTGIFQGLRSSTISGNTGILAGLQADNIYTTGNLQFNGNLKGINFDSAGTTGLRNWYMAPVSDGRFLVRSLNDSGSLSHDAIVLYKDSANGSTGIDVARSHFGATKYIKFSTGKVTTSDMFINTETGKVGIGNTGPAYQLDVTGTVQGTTGLFSGIRTTTSSVTGNTLYIGDNTSSNVVDIKVKNNTANDPYIRYNVNKWELSNDGTSYDTVATTSITRSTITGNTNATATTGTTMYLLNPTTILTLNLPSPVNNNATFRYVNIQTGFREVSISCPGYTIDGQTTKYVYLPNETGTIISDGANWRTF